MTKLFYFITLTLLISLNTAFAQSKQGWKELKDFHRFMSGTFHTAEEGNFKPLREKADSLYFAAKLWLASPVPETFKKEETTKVLTKLNEDVFFVAKAVKENASDADLLKRITAAHDTFHKVVGECRADDGQKH
jgi:hypothetical protein